MFTVTVHTTGCGRARRTSSHADRAAAEATTEEDKGPSPIAPELKELAWGAGAFVVLRVLMRFVLFPKVKKGMDARYGMIRGDHETADAVRAAAAAEVAAYERELAGGQGRGRQARRRGTPGARGRARRPHRRGQRPHRRQACRGRRGRTTQPRPPRQHQVEQRSPTSAAARPSWPPAAGPGRRRRQRRSTSLMGAQR